MLFRVDTWVGEQRQTQASKVSLASSLTGPRPWHHQDDTQSGTEPFPGVLERRLSIAHVAATMRET